MLSSLTFTFFIILRSSLNLLFIFTSLDLLLTSFSFYLLRSSFNLLFIILLYSFLCVYAHKFKVYFHSLNGKKYLTNINL